METISSEQKILALAEKLRQELNDARLLDETGQPLHAVSNPLPSVEFMDRAQNRRALLEEAPGNRWLLQFFDPSGSLLATRSGRLQTA